MTWDDGLRGAAVAVAAVVAATWIALAAIHWDDFFRSDPASGVILALVQLADRGEFFPPLFDGSHWGATRYMPLPVLLGAWLDGLAGGVIEGVKLVTYTATAGIVALVAVTLRRSGVGYAVISISIAAILVSWVGLHTTLVSPRDVLPLVLQLGALALVSRTTGTKAAVAAGVLCGLAVFAKVNAVWAVVAIVVWLILRQRRSLAGFGLSLVATAGLAFAFVQIRSDGRFLSNLFDVLTSGSTDLVSLAKTPTKFPELSVAALPASLFIPAAAAAVVLALLRRTELSPFHVAYIAALAVLLVTLGDPGAGSNHYLDILVLSAIVVAALTADVRLAVPERRVLELALLVVMTWSVAAQYQVDMKEDLQSDLRSRGGMEDDTRLVAREIADQDTVLVDDANVDVVLDRQPTVLDSYLFKYLAPGHPEWADQLERQVRGKRFARIVMLEGAAGSGPPWPFGFGPAVDEAISETYRRIGEIGGYGIYAPRGS